MVEAPSPGPTSRRTSVLAALFALVALASGAAPVGAQQILLVNGTGDAADQSPGDGACDVGDGGCSLRAAIEEANALSGTDTVRFAIPDPGPHVIQPASALPAITEPVFVDGFTEPGSARNTAPQAAGINAVHMIVLDGQVAGTGLDVAAGASTITGLFFDDATAYAIRLRDAGGNVLEGNDIRPADGGVGVLVESDENRIGGTRAAARNLIARGETGVHVTGSRNTVSGNLIGIGPDGSTPFIIAGDAVIIEGDENVLGGTDAGSGNVISGSWGTGVVIDGGSLNLVQGNLIGIDAPGTDNRGHGGPGVWITGGAVSNTLGGAVPSARNVIVDSFVGVRIDQASQSNVLHGNLIGLAPDGEPMGNDDGGVLLTDTGTSFNLIGGSNLGERNVISANLETGVRIEWGAHENVVQGNFIGTTLDGRSPLANRSGLIAITNDNTIGGPGPGEGNVFGGGFTGVGVGGSGNLVEGNFIGTDPAGEERMGHVEVGLLVSGPALVVRNTIAYNAKGIRVQSTAARATLSENSVYSNQGMGIDIEPDDVNPNDDGDVDGGANDGQNFPVLEMLQVGTNVHVEGSLLSSPNSDFDIELFSVQSCDDNEHGEGRTFLGATPVSTDGSGAAPFTVDLAATLEPGDLVTATATNSNGATSEYSRCIGEPDFELAMTPTRDVLMGSTALYDVTVSRSGYAGPFDEDVSLSCRYLLPGAACTFASTVVQPGADSVVVGLLVSTSLSTPAVNSSFQVVGTSGPLERLAEARLRVADFAIEVTPEGDAPLPPSGATTYEVLVSAAGAPVTTGVALACADLPEGLACAFDDPLVVPGDESGSTTLTVTRGPTGAARLAGARIGLVGLLLIGLGGLGSGRRTTRAIIAAGLVMAVVASCGSPTESTGNGGPGSDSESYVFRVVGTVGPLVHSTDAIVRLE